MNIETNINLTKKKRIIFWTYLFAITAFAVTVTILAAKSWNPTQAFLSNDSYYYAYQVAQDWQLGNLPSTQATSSTSRSSTAAFPPALPDTKPPSITPGSAATSAATATPPPTSAL